jgi:O-antigen/teichoic acid export membrane protein
LERKRLERLGKRLDARKPADFSETQALTAEIRRVFLGDVKWLGIVQVVLRAKSLVIIPFLTRDLGAVHYGVWSQVAIITAFVSPFISWGTAFGFVRRMAGTSIEERARVFRAWIYMLLVAFAVVLLAVLAVSAPLSRHLLGSPEEGRALVALAVAFALSGAVLNAEIVWLKVNGESRIHALFLIAQAGLSLAAIVTYLLVGGSVLFLVAMTLAADVIIVAGLFARYLARYGWGRPDVTGFWAAFHYGLPLMPTAFADIGINWVDRVVLLRYLSIADVGVYNLVHGITLMIVQSLTQPVRAYYPPRATAFFNTGKMDELRTLHGLSAGTLFAIQVPAAIGLFFVAPAFIAIMAPPEFAAGAQVLPLLFLGYAIDRQNIYNQQIFEWQFRQHWITISLYGCFALNLLFNVILVPRLGLLGAGIANVTAFAARYLFILAMVRQASPLRPNHAFIAKILLAGAIMGASLWLLSHGLPHFESWHALVKLILMLAAGGGTYLAVLVALGILPAARLLAFVRRG